MSINYTLLCTLFLVFVFSCKNEVTDIERTTIHQDCIIHLDEDYQINEVYIYQEGNFSKSYETTYSDSIIRRLTRYSDTTKIAHSVFVLENGLIRHRYDSTFVNSLLTDASQNDSYEYNSDNYLVSVQGYFFDSEYEYYEENRVAFNIIGRCTISYTHSDMLNLLDLGFFIGDYFGKIDKNLKATYSTNCPSGKGTVYGPKDYFYELNSLGLVIEERILTRNYIGASLESEDEIITSYEYVFQ